MACAALGSVQSFRYKGICATLARAKQAEFSKILAGVLYRFSHLIVVPPFGQQQNMYLFHAKRTIAVALLVMRRKRAARKEEAVGVVYL